MHVKVRLTYIIAQSINFERGRLDPTLKYFPEQRYRNVEGILRIVKDSLCHRCGACIGLCPVDTFAYDRNGYPIQVADCIQCNICVQSCSGLAVDYEQIGRKMFKDRYTYGSLMGVVDRAYVGYAVDETIRSKGASGGVVTQIFDYLLETGQIKGAVAAIEDPANPARSKGIVARSREELLQTQQSRYTTSPHIHVLNTIKEEDGPFALVGLPCQIHSLRKRQLYDPRWSARIPFVIGLLCHYSLPMAATEEAGELLAPPGARLQHTRYRQRDHRGWPFNTLELTFSNGQVWRSPYGPAQTFNIVSRVSKLGRCLQCLDAAAEFSDLSVCDPWIRDSKGRWKYDDPKGYSGILVRTRTGADLMEGISAAGRLFLHEIPAREIEQGQRQMMHEKKLRTAFRLSVRKRLGLRVPVYPMTFATPDLRIIIGEVQFWFMRLLPASKTVRRLLLRLGFSDLGQYLVRRRVRKREIKAQQ